MFKETTILTDPDEFDALSHTNIGSDVSYPL